MKNQIRSLQLILTVLTVVLGLNAFTNPNQIDPIVSDIVEGKIKATQNSKLKEQDYSSSFFEAKLQFKKMNNDFDMAISRYSANEDAVPQFSLASQALYVYEQELSFFNFDELNRKQQAQILETLLSIKREFYDSLNAIKLN